MTALLVGRRTVTGPDDTFASEPATARARVLVIEDDIPLTDVLEYNLQQAGYEVLVARDGRSGISAARPAPPLPSPPAEPPASPPRPRSSGLPRP